MLLISNALLVLARHRIVNLLPHRSG